MFSRFMHIGEAERRYTGVRRGLRWRGSKPRSANLERSRISAWSAMGIILYSWPGMRRKIRIIILFTSTTGIPARTKK